MIPFRSLLRTLLASRGYTVIKTKHLARPTMERALEAVVHRGHEIRTVVDVGASDGRWSQLASHYLVDCRYLLIEAKEEHRPALARLATTEPAMDYVIAAAGSHSGSAFLRPVRPLGGRVSLERESEDDLNVPMVSVDREVEARNLPGPYLLKMDTHGFEVTILEGARMTLELAEILVVECYNYRISEDSLLLHEMCKHLDSLGFRCIDLVEPRYRPYDDSFWQANLVFARSKWAGFSYNRYH